MAPSSAGRFASNDGGCGFLARGILTLRTSPVTLRHLWQSCRSAEAQALAPHEVVKPESSTYTDAHGVDLISQRRSM